MNKYSGSGAAGCKNVSGILSSLISNKYATLFELDNYYSYSDALDLHEIFIVNSYNEWISHKEAEKRGNSN